MKGKTNLLKAITLALICALIVNLPVVRATTASVNTEKIDKELLEIIDSAKANDTIPVAIWFNEIDPEEIESDVKATINVNRETISDSFSTASDRKATSERYTNADVDQYIETERELYSKAQTESHNAFIEKHDWLQTNKRGTDEEKIKFVSKYAPMMIAELTSNEILTLSKDSDVQNISYSPNQEFVNASNIANSVTKADVVRDTIGYTGSGIKIGMIEPELPDPNTIYLNGKGIVYDPNVDRVYSDHATLVAAIMIGNNITVQEGTTHLHFKGIVPDAQLYATRIKNDDYVYSGIEWLLDSGVNVINMSAGKNRNVANYSDLERWIDHIAINHSVHFVIAAGNPNLNIGEPGLAYNAITVGNVDDKNTLNQSDDEIYSTSAYIENNGPNKPDLVAPGTDVRYGNMTTISVKNSQGIMVETDCTGNSFSAPQVTAIVAQLCQWHTTLKTKQDAMKAILTASINHSEHRYTPADDEYDKYGAGVVNAQEALYTINHNNYVSSYFAANTAQATYHYYDLNVTSLNKKRVTLTWLKYVYFSQTHTNPPQYEGNISNLSLSIWDPNGNFVVLSAEADNNTEIVEFTPRMEGTYKIAVTTANTSNQKVYYAVSWYY